MNSTLSVVAVPGALDWGVLCIGTFLIGSIPFGLIVGKLFYGADLRSSGSGNVGAANALRSLGKTGGASVLLLDALKGLVPVWFAPIWLAMLLGEATHDWREIATTIGLGGFIALIAVLGHCYSPWLRFKGGKGVATWLGALFGLSWIAGLVFIVTWLTVVIPTRYASLGSMIAAGLSPIVLWFVSHDLVVTLCAALVALLIIWKHRENIARLREGRENRIA